MLFSAMPCVQSQEICRPMVVALREREALLGLCRECAQREASLRRFRDAVAARCPGRHIAFWRRLGCALPAYACACGPRWSER